MGEESGSHESAEKTPTVSSSTDEVGGVFSRSEGCFDVAVAGGSSLVGPLSSSAKVGQTDFATTFIDGPVVGCPITRAEVGLHVSSSDVHFDGLSDITKTVDSPNVGFPTML